MLEKQELEFDKERIRLNGQYQKLMEKYQEERRIREELEKELENHKEVLARTIKSDQQTLFHLNELVVKSGGKPIEIPNVSEI